MDLEDMVTKNFEMGEIIMDYLLGTMQWHVSLLVIKEAREAESEKEM